MASTTAATRIVKARDVEISAGPLLLYGELKIPANATGIVLFAHGSGSSRHSPRNQYVAGVIREVGVATLLFDLLTRQEEAIDNYTREFRFDINLLARRLIAATNWLAGEDETKYLRPGYFGASTGGAAALVAAAEMGERSGLSFLEAVAPIWRDQP
jgi:predicted alpha/beta-hydrolase family hydrolase